MWRVLQAANRPWPVLSEDSLIDYMVMEAVYLKVQREDRDAEKKAERRNWKKDKTGYDHLREVAG